MIDKKNAIVIFLKKRFKDKNSLTEKFWLVSISS